jgi:hypothetical protein
MSDWRGKKRKKEKEKEKEKRGSEGLEGAARRENLSGCVACGRVIGFEIDG